MVYNLLAIEIKITFLKLRVEILECGILDSHTNPLQALSNHCVSMICNSAEQNILILFRPVLKVAPRRAEPSEFRSILPGSARRDSYKTNLTLGSTESNHTPKASRLGRPGATCKANFSRATSNCSFNERMYSNA